MSEIPDSLPAYPDLNGDLMLGVTQASGDFDTIKSTSNITIGAGSSWENIPESVSGVLETQAYGDYMVQQYTTLNSGNRYWRFSVDKGNTWRSWFSSVVKKSDLGIVITKSAAVAAISGQTVKIATITLLAGHTYLILGGTNASAGDAESQTSCMLQRDSGDVTSSFGLAFSRAPMDAGGGSTSWVVVKTTSQCVYSVNGYGYSSKEYNYTGLICAIQLA